MTKTSIPELLVTAGSLKEMETVVQAGADAVQIGESRFGLRMPGKLQTEDVGAIIAAAHEKKANVYVSVNSIIENEQLDDLRQYLHQLARYEADAIVFGDPAVAMLVKQEQLDLPLHWNAEMTVTNYSTANFWQKRGAVRAILARELNLEEIEEFREKAKLDIQIQVHGMTNIYHSKRHLVQSYMDHMEKELPDGAGLDQGYYVIERERKNLRIPIYEDIQGTHMMSPDDLCMLDVLDEVLEVRPNSMKIEGLLKSLEYNQTVVEMYRKALDAYAKDPEHYEFDENWLSRIQELQPKGRELSYGFYFKEQVY